MTNVELLAEYVIHLRAERGLSHHSIAGYETDLEQFAEQLERRHRTLFTATKDDVAAFIFHLEAHGIIKRSRARKLSSLRGFYRWLVRHERLELDPTRLAISPRPDKLLPRPVEQSTLFEILDRLGKRAAADDASALELRDYAIVETLYTAGMRVAELCGLGESDVVLSAAKALVMGKGGKERVVPLGGPAVAALRNYLHHGRRQLVKKGKTDVTAFFLSEQGTQITPRRVRQICGALSGEEHIHPHRLRHSCATHMLDGGADIRRIQELHGHASLSTTQIYTHVSNTSLQDAHARFHPRG